MFGFFFFLFSVKSSVRNIHSSCEFIKNLIQLYNLFAFHSIAKELFNMFLNNNYTLNYTIYLERRFQYA